jgi:hypothetical protein
MQWMSAGSCTHRKLQAVPVAIPRQPPASRSVCAGASLSASIIDRASRPYFVFNGPVHGLNCGLCLDERCGPLAGEVTHREPALLNRGPRRQGQTPQGPRPRKPRRPSPAAYRAYVENYSDRLITLRQAGETGSSPSSARRSAAVTHPAVPPVLLLLECSCCLSAPAAWLRRN